MNIFVGKKPVRKHNKSHLNNLDSQLVCIDAILNVKVGLQVILTSRIDVDDRLGNGLVGRVTKLNLSNNSMNVLYVKFNDNSAELVAR